MPAVSKKQQRYMGMVHAVQKGEMKAPSKAVAETAHGMKPSSAKHFAETKTKGLPEKKASLMDVLTKIAALGSVIPAKSMKLKPMKPAVESSAITQTPKPPVATAATTTMKTADGPTGGWYDALTRGLSKWTGTGSGPGSAVPDPKAVSTPPAAPAGTGVPGSQGMGQFPAAKDIGMYRTPPPAPKRPAFIDWLYGPEKQTPAMPSPASQAPAATKPNVGGMGPIPVSNVSPVPMPNVQMKSPINDPGFNGGSMKSPINDPGFNLKGLGAAQLLKMLQQGPHGGSRTAGLKAL